MPLGDSTIVLFNEEENLEGGLALEALTRKSLINVQNSVRSVGDQVYQLTHGHPTAKIVSNMESLISESATTVSTLEDQLKQWKKSTSRDTDTAALVLPPLGAGLNAEVEKLRRFQKMVTITEKQLQSSDLIDSFTEADDASGHTAVDSTVSPSTSASINRFEFTDTFREELETIEQQQQQQPVSLPYESSRPPSQPVSVCDFSTYSELEQPSSPIVNASSSHPRVSRGQQQCFSSNPIEFALPGVVGRHFYDHADDDGFKNVVPSSSSLSSSTTGRSGSPISDDEEERGGYPTSSTLSNDSATPTSSSVHQRQSQALTADNFLEDDYLNQSYRSRPNTSDLAATKRNNEPYDHDDDDDIQEFSGLLSRGSVRSASYLDGWHLAVDQPRHQDNNDLELYVSRERLRGVHRIKAQLSQISNVFRDLAHLINEQQDDLDLIDSNIMNIKNSTGSAVEELRRANIVKQRARRRNLFMILVTTIVAAIVIFVYFVQSPSSAPPYILTKPSSNADSTPIRRVKPRRDAISFRKGEHPFTDSTV